ncbi:MAG: ATP-binding cassette domain-containing protein [Phycisphaera sp.]|nr:ATP-binding cassette domain-containing protein [Phycisphaera sp.]
MPVMSKPLVVDNVVKRFGRGDGQVVALDRICFEVDHGDFVAVMGASGSGKSTLLHLMAGLTQADGGHVLVNGQDLTAMNDKRLTLFRREHIGLVFQQFNLIPTLSAAENVALPLRFAGVAEKTIQERVATMLGKLGLGSRAKHRPDALSGGEQQRVAIGRALITNPAVVLADEPTGNLDSANSDAICRVLRELNETDNVTIVMVTHEPSVGMYARRAVFIRDGQLCRTVDTTDVADAAALGVMYQEVLSGGGSAAPTHDARDDEVDRPVSETADV